jgi:protein ImuA
MQPEVVKWGGKRAEILAELQSEILRLQGYKPFGNSVVDVGLGPIKDAFPNGSFPLGAVHEFISSKTEDFASTCGFLSALVASLLESKGTALWISSNRTLFPPALKLFGVQPERCIFIDLQKERDVVWAMDEALKCGALSAVVGEVQDITFTASRRLQLAVEQSQVTGFVLRKSPGKVNTTACISRWKITALPGVIVDELPGIGLPTWRVELLRMRNGKVGSWDVKWINGKFVPVSNGSYKEEHQKKAG